ncbi:MAG: hypothetical protein A2Y93_17365 [Chloroflexi bacterium RBG_13_68_17]|nr:MAG: hypothetical protein A2Y93_17365 [Chloroflexi bacterium RBG_13_68_17]
MNRRLFVVVAATLLLPAQACAGGGLEEAATAAASGQVSGQTEAAASGACDPRATPLEINRAYDLQMHSTSDAYPANCLYYCLSAPEVSSSIQIDVRDFNADLDLFVGYGDYESVTGEMPVEGESFNWKSNHAGTDDEQVLVSDAQPGVYYIEVCSYRGDSTPFELSTDVR